MTMQGLFRVLSGCTMLLIACAADSSKSAAVEGKELLMTELRQTFDELARPDGACMSGRLGNDKSCETEAAWKQYLSDACAAHGMAVESTTPTESCGSGQFRYSDFSCCPTSSSTPEPNCANLVEGGPSVCKPLGEWKQNIIGICAGQGLQVGEVFFGQSCGADAARSVRFSCCGAQPLDPPAADCQPFSAGGAGACKTPEEWKVTVSNDCTGKGLALGDLSLGGDCGSGRFSTTAFLCCGARPTPPPTPTCFSKDYETPGCRTEADWQKVATAVCQNQSLKLDAIAYADSCGTGSWQNMKYACCPQTTGTPDPPMSSCTTQLLEEGGACNDQATWRDRAIRACAAAGAQLKELTFGTPCAADKYLAAKANCCP